MKTLIQKIIACETNTSTGRIANALLWAAVILITAWLTSGSEHANTFFIITLCLATTAILFLDQPDKE